MKNYIRYTVCKTLGNVFTFFSELKRIIEQYSRWFSLSDCLMVSIVRNLHALINVPMWSAFHITNIPALLVDLVPLSFTRKKRRIPFGGNFRQLTDMTKLLLGIFFEFYCLWRKNEFWLVLSPMRWHSVKNCKIEARSCATYWDLASKTKI